MAGDNNQKSIVFVTRSGLQFYSTVQQTLVPLTFGEREVRDVDVVDRQAFGALLGAFITQNKLPPSPILFVFAEPICFYQDIGETNPSKIEKLTEEFVNTVPFETLLTRTYPVKNGARIVSINEKLYRDIAGAFEAGGFISIGVVPSFALGARFTALPALDTNSAHAILSDVDRYRQQNFLDTPVNYGSEDDGSGVEVPGSKGIKFTPRLIALVAIFVVLVGVFVFLLIRG